MKTFLKKPQLSIQRPFSIEETLERSFSSEEVAFKLWACEELESKIEALFNSRPVTIWCYEDSLSVFSFLLLSRKKTNIECIRSFHESDSQTHFSNMLLENWVIDKWKFRALKFDICHIEPEGNLSGYASRSPDIIIHPSTDTSRNQTWWNNVPNETLVLLMGAEEGSENEKQTRNSDHYAQSFQGLYSYFKGSKTIHFESIKLTKHMVIGIKDARLS